MRTELESNGQTIYEQWKELKKNLVKDCDIDRTGYHLDLADEKRIGKAKVAKPVTTQTDAFSHLQHLNLCKENAFLFRNQGGNRNVRSNNKQNYCPLLQTVPRG